MIQGGAREIVEMAHQEKKSQKEGREVKSISRESNVVLVIGILKSHSLIMFFQRANRLPLCFYYSLSHHLKIQDISPM